ncbi:hypothetical protein PV08_06629 [Exophiala spinifera]|uniref:Uncharacterized protein n=1 Tax=Exophiala spinifera TaxID=91928 RepID=A0A0D2BRG1_9EURO|nr:uncharacterized protein PV08_06629 [Exophiala spinifera]KIW13849.1 hypothetical protein PV08_06629 [Exophiala spinifera]
MPIPVLSQSPSKVGRPPKGPRIPSQQEAPAISQSVRTAQGHVGKIPLGPDGKGQQRDGNPIPDPVVSRSENSMSGASLSHSRSKSAAETLSTFRGISQTAGNIPSMSRPRSIQQARNAAGKDQVLQAKPTRSHTTATSVSRNNIGVKNLPSAPTSNSSSDIGSTTSTRIPPTSIPTSHTRTRSYASSRPRVDDSGRAGAPTRQTASVKSEAKPAASAPVHASSHSKAAPDMGSAIRRPAFNTYNQHFSPKKIVTRETKTTATVKPEQGSHHPPHLPPPSSAHGASISATPTDNVGSNLRIHDELIQLGLIYNKAASNMRAYRSSVHHSISSARRDVDTQLASLSVLERAQQHRFNAFTLGEWLRESKDIMQVGEGNAALSPDSSHAKDQNEGGGWEVDQSSDKSDSRLLILAQFTHRMAEIVREHGELDALMTEFDQWCQSALTNFQEGTDFANANANADMNRVGAYDLIPLNPRWASSASSIEATVKACRDSICNLPTTGAAKDDQSCIVALIKTLSQLSDRVLEEIAMCKVVEGLISQYQQDRVDKALADALAEAAQIELSRNGCVSSHQHHLPRKGVWENVRE